jgi:hypothetical protein
MLLDQLRMAKIVVETAPFKNPKWSAAKLKPGDKAKLTVEAPKIKASQRVEFQIRSDTGLVHTVSSKEGSAEAEWVVPNLPHKPKLKFDALLKEKPSPANGHRAVLDKVESPEAEVAGYKVEITKIDAAFVPKTEKIEVTWKVTDPEGAAKRGRIEIWGERYPSDKPLYTETFKPADGSKEWKTWDGKANAGILKDAYITPEFAPYRIRVIIGPNSASVEKPYTDGVGKATAAEKAFEVIVESVWIRVQKSLTESTGDDEYKLSSVLAVEPRKQNGKYKRMGKLPTDTEHGRIRIPMARHSLETEDLDQGGLLVGAGYMDGGGSTKWEVDHAVYSRPQIPVEFEVRLKSRVDANNTDDKKKGLWVSRGIGPIKIEPVAEDFYRKNLFEGGGDLQTYWKNAAFKVKRGKHDQPQNSSNQPIFSFWQARFEVGADDQEDFNISSFDDTMKYKVGSSELTVYLNRAKLECTTSDDDLEKGRKDYKEVDDHTIKLRPKFAKQNDILWIVRKDSTAGGTDVVNDWETYPPGVNCHEHYGGVRGKKPTGARPNIFFLKDYAAGEGSEPVIGHAADFPWKEADLVNLKPDPVDPDKQERVELTAITKSGDAKRGLAGVLFSPSTIAGDSYLLKGLLDRCPYERNLGCVSEDKPKWEGKTGDIAVWRWMRIDKSLRMPNKGQNNLAAKVGSKAESANRAYPGDGRNMMISAMNTMEALCFNEWTTKAPAGGGDVHQDIDLDAYINAHNNSIGGGDKGRVAIPNRQKIKNHMSQYDHYRVRLPPGFPNNRRKVAAACINGLEAGTPSKEAMRKVDKAIKTHEGGNAAKPDLAAGPTIQVSTQSADDYFDWVDGITTDMVMKILNALTPKTNPPKKMNVVRWVRLQDFPIWNSGRTGVTTIVWEGICVGDGQSVFHTVEKSTTLFAHEMGHSCNLAHFVAENFAWKHHDLILPTCYMSYNYTAGIILKPGAGVAAGGTPDTGWPHTVPAALPDPCAMDASGNSGDAAILFGPGLAPSRPCAKCSLKLRGWKDDVLPCAWKHPDLF